MRKRLSELAGVLCDRKIPTKIKVLLNETAIKLALMSGNEVWSLILRQEDKTSATEMRIFQLSLYHRLAE